MRNGPARVALVTGANRGLGLETARQLPAKGLSVVLAGRDAAALERARRSLAEHDRRRALTVRMDVTRVESIAEAQRAVTEYVGSVDVLVNNTARGAPIAEESTRGAAVGQHREPHDRIGAGIVSTASLIVGVAAANAGRSEMLLAGVAGLVAA